MNLKSDTRHLWFRRTTNLTRTWTLRGGFGRNKVAFSRFFPLLREKLAEARVADTKQGLNPDDATAVTKQSLADAEAADISTGRKTISLTTRFSSSKGRLRGLPLAVQYAGYTGKTGRRSRLGASKCCR